MVILNADFIDVHEISLTKTLYTVQFALKIGVQPDDGRYRGRNMSLLRLAM